MSRTVEAVVERDGSLRLLEDVELVAGERVLVTLPDGPEAAEDAADWRVLSLRAAMRGMEADDGPDYTLRDVRPEPR